MSTPMAPDAAAGQDLTAPDIHDPAFWQREPVLLSGVVVAILALAASFGLNVDNEKIGGITAAITAGCALLGSWLARRKVDSPVTAATKSRRLAQLARDKQEATANAGANDVLLSMISYGGEVAEPPEAQMSKPYGLQPMAESPDISAILAGQQEQQPTAGDTVTEPDQPGPEQPQREGVAVGIHDHPTRKLGKRPAIEGRPAIAFADHLTAIPAHPVADVAPTLSWPMDENDAWGDCVVAALDHALEAIYVALTGAYANWTKSQIVQLYRTQNPQFDPGSQLNGPGSGADGGMVIQLFLEYLVKQGVILGFGRVNLKNEDEVKAAIWLGLGVVTGEDLAVAQQTQSKVWDYVPGSGDWGGHSTTWVGFPGSPDYDSTVTWGELVQMTQPFIAHQVSEAWFIVTQAHVDHPQFRDHYDLASFAAAYTALTGRPFPAVIPPPTPQPPGPGPAPVPVPTGDAFTTAVGRYPGLDAWLARRGAKHHVDGKPMSDADYAAWLAAGEAGLR